MIKWLAPLILPTNVNEVMTGISMTGIVASSFMSMFQG